ncbi:VirB3 family type IV secretion system protein [Shewanella sp. 202IG2-18]|uniref:type IV secretion system protein VirB3 n=1 Tax=Parashewanella hymeniacidonis TaxID=2807618 RepID=UPI001961FDCF|nr:VirB3 family type IV secretion system protein [Parashewanella hymeniacidonis]MBM7074259.1 VirB3 family type IV secretion system protein [Parashewanella hymeniacidonis]
MNTIEMNRQDPLFVAVTRPAMKWGVTLDGMIIAGALVAVVMIATKNPFSLLLYLPVHALMYGLCLRDPRIFRLLYLWLNTKAKSLGWRYFGAATASPLVNSRKHRYSNLRAS